jgi:CRP-like cAMP-binding protein
MTIDHVDMLQQTGLTEGLSRDEVELLIPVCRECQYTGGEEIFGEASKGTELYIICKGRVSLEVELPNRPGRRAERLATATAGMIFGELALVDGSPRSARARALDDTTVLEINSVDIHQVMETHPRIGFIIMLNLATVLATRLRNTNLWLRNELLWSR